MKNIKLIYSFVSLVFLVGCVRGDNKSEATKINNYKDSMYELFSKRVFYLSNNEGYLKDKLKYDYYILYTISPRNGDEVKFSIKSYDSMAMVSMQINHMDKEKMMWKKVDDSSILNSYYQRAITVYRKNQDVRYLKDLLDKFKGLIHKSVPTEINENPSGVNYFDGDQFYIITAGTTTNVISDNIDSSFQKSKLFLSLRERLR